MNEMSKPATETVTLTVDGSNRSASLPMLPGTIGPAGS